MSASFDAQSGRNNGSEKPSEGLLDQLDSAFRDSLRGVEDGIAGGKSTFECLAQETKKLEDSGTLPKMTREADGSLDIAASRNDEGVFSVAERSRAAAEQQEAPQAA